MIGAKVTDDCVPGSSGRRESESLSSSLLERVRAHDATAWRRLVHLFTPLVWSWCRQAGFQQADAEDFGQEVFAAVHRGICRYQKDGRRGSFRRWLRTITNNKIRDRIRQEKKTPGGVAPGGSENGLAAAALHEIHESDQESADREDAELFRRAMGVVREHFTSPTWEAFHQQVVLGRKAADVAADLNMTRDAVYLAKSRIIKRLREEFEELGIQ
jgi:RNA polymerase sigma-70 factor (ECF subfamily)